MTPNLRTLGAALLLLAGAAQAEPFTPDFFADQGMALVEAPAAHLAADISDISDISATPSIPSPPPEPGQ